MRLKKYVLLFAISLLFSCFSRETNNPEQAYLYWSGSEPPEEIKLINGQYYQSPHFTLEYELFLEFQTNDTWFNDYVRINDLEKDTIGNDWSLWTKLPKWFYVDSSFQRYARDQHDEFEKSRYFYNPETGKCYIYETLGM